MIWLAYEFTKDEKYRRAGEHHIKSFAERMDKQQDVDHHDLGFLYTPTCIAPWRLTGNTDGKAAALRAADQLMHRFWDKPGIFQAWGRMDDPEQRGRTIVDSLMNMPLLFWASDVSKDGRYRDAAYRHCCQLRDHFVRPDNTTFHTFYFDVETGAPRFGKTAQGAADNSCWARGQAWAIYGFVLGYAYTHDAGLLQTACRVADYFLAHLPADKVAYWDLVYTDGSGEERDSSAASIAVCALQEIARSLPAGPEQTRYAAAAARHPGRAGRTLHEQRRARCKRPAAPRRLQQARRRRRQRGQPVGRLLLHGSADAQPAARLEDVLVGCQRSVQTEEP